MTTDPLERVIQTLKESIDCDDRSDAELLKRMRVNRDASAVETIVRRHGPKVLAACRKVLGVSTDVEDAFQATFLVLLRNPMAIRRKASLGSWLFGVAHRIALQARLRQSRRPGALPEAASNGADISWQEACAILHEELNRLPDATRLPLVLCYLDGLSRDEAARELGRTMNSIKKSLEKGRELLRERLSHRGITLSAGLLAAVAESAPSMLSVSTIGVTLEKLAQPTDMVERLAREYGSFGYVTRLVGTSLAISALVFAAALGVWGLPGPHTSAKEAPAKKEAPPEQPAVEEKLTFAGRVVDPEGKPVQGAKIHFGGRKLAMYFDIPGPELRAVSDEDGRFHFEFKKDNPRVRIGAIGLGLVLIARLEGYGIAMELVSDQSASDLTLKLIKDEAFKGRLIDKNGKPVVGATVRVVSLHAPDNDDLTLGMQQFERYGWTPGVIGDMHHFQREMLEGPHQPSLLPDPSRTNRDGEFMLKGLGLQRLATLRFEGPTIATTEIRVLHQRGEPFRIPHTPWKRWESQRITIYRSGFEFVVQPTQVIEGTVRDKESGRPLAGFVVGSSPIPNQSIDNQSWKLRVRSTTDEKGRYRLVGNSSGSHRVYVIPPAGQPYFRAAEYGGRKESVETTQLEFSLAKCVWVNGSITDIRTQRPVTQARILYRAYSRNPKQPEQLALEREEGSLLSYSKDDGTFRILALPGRGWLTVEHDEAFVPAHLREIQSDFEIPKISRGRSEARAQVGIEVDAKKPKEYAITLDSGERIPVVLFDADGKPVTEAMILEPGRSSRRQWSKPLPTEKLEVALSDPEHPQPLIFYHPERALGTVYRPDIDDKSGLPLPRSEGEVPSLDRPTKLKPTPWKVTLQPTATAMGRLLGHDGKPLVGKEIRVHCPGFPQVAPPKMILLTKTDAEGRFRFSNLIAPWNYQAGYSNGIEPGMNWQSLDFDLKPGETKDLGNLRPRVVGK